MHSFIEWRAEVEKAKVLKGMNDKDLARACGYSYKYMLNIMHGRAIGQPCVDCISLALGIDTYKYCPEDRMTIIERR